MRSLFILLTLLSSSAIAQAGESPREFARRFYAAHQTWTIRGVPTSEDEGIISQFMGIEIIHAFRRVNEHRRLESKKYDPKNPMKPRWCGEGDVFCASWEGITHYSIESTRQRNGRWVVGAKLEYIEGLSSFTWTDRLVLDRAGEDWVVSDIEFDHGETLITSILEELAKADKEIPKVAANKNKIQENKSVVATPMNFRFTPQPHVQKRVPRHER